MSKDTRKTRNHVEIGAFLKAERERAGMTQKALADEIGLSYYTMISQMELGYIAVPPSLWVPIANALGLKRSSFVLEMLLEIQPEVYRALFGSAPRQSVEFALTNIESNHQ